LSQRSEDFRHGRKDLQDFHLFLRISALSALSAIKEFWLVFCSLRFFAFFAVNRFQIRKSLKSCSTVLSSALCVLCALAVNKPQALTSPSLILIDGSASAVIA
jgi:hypothetical protein